MKKIYLSLVAAAAISSAVNAQCGGRYDVDQYGVTATSGITYGSNINYQGSTTVLKLDFYEPTGDTLTSRPLIIWAHGGSFLSGTSADSDVDTLCHRFAKKGYACASINYRLGIATPDSFEFIKALVRAVQDMKASIRFFHANASTYKIDTNNIFIGGSSAGAFMALHAAYLKRSCQVTAYMPQDTLDKLGGLSGYSGNQCYSEKINGVINLCGALGTYGWLEAGDLPFCSMHGTSDNTVNYSRGEVLPSYLNFGIRILTTDGSRMLYEQAQAIGIQNNFYTWYGADHVPYAYTSSSAWTASEKAYMDTTVNFVHDYLLQRLGYSCTISQATNTPYGNANLYAFTNCNTNSPLSCNQVGIKKYESDLILQLYPNPASQNITVEFSNSSDIYMIQLCDISGRIIKSDVCKQGTYTLERGSLSEGVYFVKVSNMAGELNTHKIIFTN